MEKALRETGLSPERAARIREAQKRHETIDPGCEKLSLEEFIRWHPIGGMTWEERAEAMRKAGIVVPEDDYTEEAQRQPCSAETIVVG